jgi:moderate conductance mechanosensitive channel
MMRKWEVTLPHSTQDKGDDLMRRTSCLFYARTARVTGWLFIAGLTLICFTTGSFAKAKASAPQTPSIETIHPESMNDINKLLSRLSDDQVREILIQQLAKSLPQTNASFRQPGLSGMLRQLESFSILLERRISELGHYLPRFFPDMAQTFEAGFEGAGLTDLLLMFLGLVVIIGLALAVEQFCRRFSAGIRDRFDAAPEMQGWLRFSAAIVRILPEFLGIVIFSLISGLLFAVIPFSRNVGWRPLFIAVMLVIVSVRLITLLSRMIWSPDAAQLRLVTVSDETAAILHRNLTRLAAYFVVLDVLLLFLQKLEASPDSMFFTLLVLSIPFMWMIKHFLWNSRTIVANHLRQTGMGPSGNISWIRQLMASGWHLLVMGYTAILWLLAIGRFALFGPQHDQAFVTSFLIIPLYMILVRAGKWLITETLGTIRKTEAGENTRYFVIAMKLVRVVIVLTLGFWLFNIWGIDLPIIQEVVHASFSILVTLVLAHMIWGQINRYIQQKLETLAPEPAEKKEDHDDEFSGIILDRSFTLLPMLRKFVGTVLVVMVSLIVLSSLGINIGPLMAGAGVVGLALGFGAQKLVADVLSGIFYLVDDAFRVGEYIQAGSVSGTVEGFTLRNVMMRHHRGALQIVPFSKLGAITNYNRGGMVMKFNLELPYDTDVNQVRKVIKKVNQKVMEDPELGPDLLQPIKSQGIKKVADSVMSFRVKFTAKPGKQFVIQRKAFQLITEQLAKKGIHFAHRKVIVELPTVHEDTSGTNAPEAAPSPEVAEHLKAGAAAALTRILVEEEQEAAALAKTKK